MADARKIVARAANDFVESDSLEAGASIAFYTLFSVFPLIIVLIPLLGVLLEQQEAQAQVLSMMQRLFPVSQADVVRLMENDLVRIIEGRGSLNIFATIGLIWAGSNVFSVLTRHINLAWGRTSEHVGFLHRRLMAFGIISLIAAAILLSVVLTTTFDVLSRLHVPFLAGTTLSDTPFWVLVSQVVLYAYNFALFVTLYRWVPRVKVKWWEAMVGAAFATVAWQLALAAFAVVVRVGLSNYQLIYGPLTTLVTTMFWIYSASLIVLFGAHLSAACAKRPTVRAEA